jgi:hypothetical protein
MYIWENISSSRLKGLLVYNLEVSNSSALNYGYEFSATNITSFDDSVFDLSTAGVPGLFNPGNFTATFIDEQTLLFFPKGSRFGIGCFKRVTLGYQPPVFPPYWLIRHFGNQTSSA